MAIQQPAGGVTVLATGDFRDVVLSPDGRTVYVSDTAGRISALNADTGERTAQWQAGVKLGGMDISADGRYLAAAELQADASETARVHIIELTTGKLTTHAVSYPGSDVVSDVAIVKIPKYWADRGELPISDRWFFSIGPRDENDDQTVVLFSNVNLFSTSSNHESILIATTGISSAPIGIYTPNDGHYNFHPTHTDGVSGFNYGAQVISADGKWIAQTADDLYIYDGKLNFVANVSDIQGENFGQISGVEFSNDDKHFYVLDYEKDKIFQLSTSSWKIENVFSLGVDVAGGYSNGFGYGDRINMTPDGSRLVVFGDNLVLSVDLKAIVPDGGTDSGDDLHGDAAANKLEGYGGDDWLDGGAGNDTLIGGRGSDWVQGGDGRDVISDVSGDNTLWGGNGADSIAGGDGFDQINGNMGDDIAFGGNGNDWVVGGQDRDLLYGDSGDDVVYGNLGADNCYGGEGADWVRGGQGDDIIDGGGGNDWMAGDRGNDTVTGGAGADKFYFFAGAAIDRVTDFSSAAGDRVLLDAGQAYTVKYTTEGTVIDLGNGDQMILVGVTQASLGDWLVI